MDYEGIDTCKAASQFYGGQWACGYGCLGLGDCAAACDYGAICVADGLAVVDREKCVGCGMCAKPVRESDRSAQQEGSDLCGM